MTDSPRKTRPAPTPTTPSQHSWRAWPGGGTQQAAKAHHQAKHAKSADSVTLSDSAKSLAAARDAVKNAPDVRDDKVSEIKQQVSDGTYKVSAKALARKMLDQS